MTDQFLTNLENLLTEFYSPSSTNVRKSQIETELQKLSETTSVWQYCVKLLQFSKSQYTMWWALSTLENFVCKKWNKLDDDTRYNLKQFMFNCAKEGTLTNQAPFIVTKYIVVFINIGIRQWATNPQFFEQIMTLVSGGRNITCGLTMLLVLSEELHKPRNDLSSEQRTTCKKLLNDHVPIILSAVIGLLDSLTPDKRHVTPHSSPGSNPSASPLHGGSPLALCNTSPLHSTAHDLNTSGSSELFTHLLQQPHSKTLLVLDETNTKIGVAALQCLAHLLSWVPISEVVTPGLLSTVFVYARQGTSDKGNVLLGTHAMSCINEIVGRNLVPKHMEEFILHLFHQTLQLLYRVAEEGPDKLDRGYLKKFIEFLNLFTSGHLRRVESNASFPILDFLSLLFKFTFNTPDIEVFYEALFVCSSWVDFLLSLQGYMSPDGTIQRYGDALKQLTELLIHKMRFNTNSAQLEEIDHETDLTGEVEQTEWDIFLGRITQLLSKIIELCPVQVADVLISLYKEHCEVFYQLQPHVNLVNQEIKLDKLEASVAVKVLRDIATLTHITQLVLPSLTGDYYLSRHDLTQGLLFHCMKCIDLATRISSTRTTNEKTIKWGFCEIFINNVYILTTFTQWFLQFGYHHKNSQQYTGMVSTVLNAVLPSFNNQEVVRVQEAVIELLYKIILALRPSFILTVPSVQTLYTNSVAQQYLNYSSIAISTLNKSLTLGLVLPWLHASEADQQWDIRQTHFNQFVQGLLGSFMQIKESDVGSSVKLMQHTPAVTRAISCLCDIVSCVAHRENKAKQIVCKAIKPAVSHMIRLLPLFEKDSKIFENVFYFTNVLCDALRVQLGAHFLQELVGLCLKAFTDNISNDLGRTILEKFIDLLTTVVREPSSIYKSFIGDIITISIEQISTHLDKRQILNMTYFSLLHSILDYHWTHFYPRNSPNREICANELCFMKIFQMFGESFLKSDFNLIKQNLLALTDLHDKHELFHKELFKANLKSNFVTVLLQLLFSGSVSIIEEELEDTLYQLVQPFEHVTEFYVQPLTVCLHELLPDPAVSAVLSKLELHYDVASFKLNLRLLIGDAKFYLSCGS